MIPLNEIIKMKTDLVVAKDNQLIQNFGFDLSVYEQRILLLCIAKMDSRNELSNRTFTLHVSDLHNDLGLNINSNSTYELMDEAVTRLFHRFIYPDQNNRKIKLRWLTMTDYRSGPGEITISFAPEVMIYLSALKSRFTTYKFKYVTQFTCAYSFRFYELFSCWNGKGKQELKLEVARLKQMLDLGEKYANIHDFKKYVILPALKEINEFTDVSVTFDQCKRGKVITHLIFYFAPKNPEKKPKKITKAYIEKHARPGESYPQAHARLSKNIGKNHEQ